MAHAKVPRDFIGGLVPLHELILQEGVSYIKSAGSRRLSLPKPPTAQANQRWV